MIITDISKGDGRKQRIFLDEEYCFSLYSSEIRKYKLETGQDIDEALYTELRLIAKKRLRERILYLLGDTDRTEQDIRNKMLRAGNPQELIDEVIEQLKEYHYIDDERYATLYARSLRDNRVKSRRAIETGLYSKGIARETIETVMEELEYHEESQLLRALEKKRLTPSELPELPEDKRRKLYASLQRKGFSYESLNRVFRGELEEFY